MTIKLGAYHTITRDDDGQTVGCIKIDINTNGNAEFFGLVDGPPLTVVYGQVKKSPAGHYRLMDGETCIAIITLGGKLLPAEEGGTAPWPTPSHLT